MAKGATGRCKIGSRQRRASPYPLSSISESAKKDWEDATCSVCMDYPHNAVLLLCSSYDKGCRPYMCGTSFRHSNCLDLYEKHTQVTSPHLSLRWNMAKSEVAKLQCPLCRGQVKGWTVLEHARKYLNTKKRNCMQENCSFEGTYKELKKHVKVDHPSARPHKVDSVLKQKWSRLEHDQERDDVISTIRSSMPGATFLGDYVIEANNSNDRVGLHRRVAIRSINDFDQDDYIDLDFQGSGGVSLANRMQRLRRVTLGRRQLQRDGFFY